MMFLKLSWVRKPDFRRLPGKEGIKALIKAEVIMVGEQTA